MITYWRISHSPDTTETGLCIERTYVMAEWFGHEMQEKSALLIEQFCFERFGSKVDYVQGVAPTEAWDIMKIDEAQWMEAQPIRWGGFPTKTMRLRLRLGKKSSLENRLHIEVVWEREAKEKIPEKVCQHCGKDIQVHNQQEQPIPPPDGPEKAA